MKFKIALTALMLALTTYGEGFCLPVKFHRARAGDISDREYEQAVIELIDNAKKSVVLGMYYISTQLEENNPVALLLNDLVEAEERGVEVRLYLNTKFPDMSYDELIKEDEFKRLKEAGCELYFIPPGRKLHDKVVVVDQRYVVEGSMNWSIIALRNNFESATLIDSPRLAKEKIKRLEAIYRTQWEKEKDEAKEREPLYLRSIIEKIELKKALLEDKKYFPNMLKASDRRAMELYLVLLAYSQNIGKNEFFLDLEDAGLGLGMPESWDDEALRRQVIRTLRTLQNRYKLIKVEFYHASDARISMLPMQGESFSIETNTIDPPNEQIPQRLEFLLLVKGLLEQEGKSLNTVPQKEIVRRFHIAERTLEKAIVDLQKKKTKIKGT